MINWSEREGEEEKIRWRLVYSFHRLFAEAMT